MNIYTQYNVPKAEVSLNLNVGQPSPSILNWNEFQDSLKYLNEQDNKIMQYGNLFGFDEYKELIKDLIEGYTNDILNKDNIIMTNGISQGMFMLASLLKKTYTKVYVENPTYFLMLNIFKDLDYEFDTYDINNLEELNNKFESDKKNNIKSLIYIIPFNQNPTGYTINNNQIYKLQNILKIYSDEIILLSDETYQLLNFNLTTKNISLTSYINLDNVISLGTFSKLISPALRLGWIYTKNNDIKLLIKNCGFMDSGGAVNQIMAKILCNYVNEYGFYSIFENNMKFLENNCNKICNILDKYKDYFEYVKPKGGYFIWVKCKMFDGKIFKEICSKNKLEFHLGDKFSPNNDFKNYFRLSFSYYNLEDYDYLDERLKISIDTYMNQFITINILGGKGRLGSLICNEAKNTKYFLINILNKELNNIIVTNKTIIVDVSSIEGNTNLLNYLIKNNYNIPLIVGTTGNLNYELINTYKNIIGEKNVLISSNFSIGINSIYKYLENIPNKYWNISIEEIHHDKKKDIPSGTALTFKNIINNNSINDINIKSIREGDVIGYHQIHLYNEHEEITIVHSAKNRSLFAKGCLEYIKKMLN